MTAVNLKYAGGPEKGRNEGRDRRHNGPEQFDVSILLMGKWRRRPLATALVHRNCKLDSRGWWRLRDYQCPPDAVQNRWSVKHSISKATSPVFLVSHGRLLSCCTFRAHNTGLSTAKSFPLKSATVCAGQYFVSRSHFHMPTFPRNNAIYLQAGLDNRRYHPRSSFPCPQTWSPGRLVPGHPLFRYEFEPPRLPYPQAHQVASAWSGVQRL